MSLAAMLLKRPMVKITAVNALFSSIVLNKVSEASWPYVALAAAAAYGLWFLARSLWRKSGPGPETAPSDREPVREGVEDRGTADDGGEDEVEWFSFGGSLAHRISFVWFVALNGAMLTLVASTSYDKYMSATKQSVYYENYVLNYGLPMGTGRMTNECVGGWYRFDFRGSHGPSDAAKCLYGENRRHKLPWCDRYRTLRTVTQVNGANQPLWFCEDGNDDGATPVMKFCYASQSDLAGAGAVPARLQVFVQTIDQLRGLTTSYVLNYWDRWGEPNALVSLTRGDTDERYYVPGTSYDRRTGYPGKSNVSGYAVRWDRQGRQVERKCKAGCDVDGIVRKTYEYKTVPLADGEEFTYISCVKSFGPVDGEETLLSKGETVWEGLLCTDRHFGDECLEERRFCRSRSTATVERSERFDVDDRFERIRDSEGNLQGRVCVYRYDKSFNLVRVSCFHDLACAHPFTAGEEGYAQDVYTWTDKGRLASHETLDERNGPVPALVENGRRLSKLEYEYGSGFLVTRRFDGTNLVSTARSSLPNAREPAAEHADNARTRTTTEYDNGKYRIVEVGTFPKEGAGPSDAYGFSAIRYVYYKQNRDEDVHPNGRIAKMEYVTRDGSLCTNAISKYYTYRQGLLTRVDNKSGFVENGVLTTNRLDYYRTDSGGYVPASNVFEYDDCGRPCCEWRLDRNDGTNALPRDMVFNVLHEYDGDSLSAWRTIAVSGLGVFTNELTQGRQGATVPARGQLP